MRTQHQPTNRSERENPNSRNYGLRSKCMETAAKNALYEKFHYGQIGYSTIDTQHARFTQFAKFVSQTDSIRDLRNLTREHVLRFADKLSERVELGDIKNSTAHNILSAVNTVMNQAIGNNSLMVSSKEAGIPPRSGITTENRAISESQHNKIIGQLPDRLGALAEMQRSLGLRFEESCKNSPQKMLDQAQTHQRVTIEYGTKGGQVRVLPITSQNQVEALQNAAKIQGSHRSMIPSQMSYSQFQNAAYKEFSNHNFRPHSERHAFAQRSYTSHLREISKVSNLRCPVEAGIKHGVAHHQHLAEKIGCSVKQAKIFDEQARLRVSEELGHHRINITNWYLG